MANDPDSQLDAILAYQQAASSWITSASALIAQLEAASTSPTNTASADLQAKIDAVIAFQAANPVPAIPTTPAPSAPVDSSTSAPSA